MRSIQCPANSPYPYYSARDLPRTRPLMTVRINRRPAPRRPAQLLHSLIVAHAFRISSARVPAKFDLDHILADVVHSPFSEAAGNDAPLLGPAQLTSGSVGVLLSSQSLKCVRFNFCFTAANVTAASTAPMALPADTDDDACEALAASATTGGA